MTKDKIKNLKALKGIVSASKRRHKKIVFTNGCFDLLHPGHIKYLEQAKKLGDKLIVGLNSDGSVRKIKGRGRPVFSQKERAALLAALECVDYVIIFNEATPLALIKALRPDLLVKGGDWRGQDVVGREIVQAYGGRVACVDFVKGYSSSSIISRIKKGK